MVNKYVGFSLCVMKKSCVKTTSNFMLVQITTCTCKSASRKTLPLLFQDVWSDACACKI